MYAERHPHGPPGSPIALVGLWLPRCGNPPSSGEIGCLEGMAQPRACARHATYSVVVVWTPDARQMLNLLVAKARRMGSTEEEDHRTPRLGSSSTVVNSTQGLLFGGLVLLFGLLWSNNQCAWCGPLMPPPPPSLQ